MKVPYKKGVAIHLDPESCARFRPQGRPRSVDRGMSRPGIEPRNVTKLRGAHAVNFAEGNTGRRVMRGAFGLARSETLCMFRNSLLGNREIPRLTAMDIAARIGKSSDVTR